MYLKALFVLRYALFVLAAAQIADASELIVKVNKEGRPLENVEVCVGTRQEPQLFGRRQTGADGLAKFAELPNGNVVVTAVKGEFGRQAVRTNHVVGWVFVDLSTPAGALKCGSRR